MRNLDADIESHVLCTLTQNLDQFRIPNIHRVPSPRLWERKYEGLLRRCRVRNYRGRVFRTVAKLEIDVFHSHFADNGWSNLPLVSKLGVPHVVTFYGYDVNLLTNIDPVWKQRYRQLFEKVTLVLCEGPHMGNCIALLGCPRPKIRVHHLGVSVSDIAYRPRQWEPGSPLRVLIAGSFREKKGIPYAIRALGLLGTNIPLEITVVGDAGPDERSQAEKGRILEALRGTRLQSQVRFMGYQKHAMLFDEAYKHHIFLSPSITASDGDTEGGAPVTIIEMAASGMPIVSTFHCDIGEVVKDGETGFLATERDTEQLAEKMRWLIEHPSSWTPFLDKGRAHIVAEFDAVKQGSRLAKLYRALVSRGPDVDDRIRESSIPGHGEP